MSHGRIRLQLRRGTAAEWTSLNPVLAEGEPGFEDDTGVLKVGDGVSAWSALPHTLQVTPGGTLPDGLLPPIPDALLPWDHMQDGMWAARVTPPTTGIEQDGWEDTTGEIAWLDEGTGTVWQTYLGDAYDSEATLEEFTSSDWYGTTLQDLLTEWKTHSGRIVFLENVVSPDLMLPSGGYLYLDGRGWSGGTPKYGDDVPLRYANIPVMFAPTTNAKVILPGDWFGEMTLLVGKNADKLIFSVPVATEGSPDWSRPVEITIRRGFAEEYEIIRRQAPVGAYQSGNVTYTEIAQAPALAAETAAGKLINSFTYDPADGQVYVAYGDWNVNTGPIDIISFNLTSKAWTTHLSAFDTEAVQVMRKFGNDLYVPGVDPQGNDGKLAVRSSGTWSVKTLPPMVHCFDVALVGTDIFVCGARTSGASGTGTVARSTDGGATWTTVLDLGLATNARIFSLVTLGGSLYAIPNAATGSLVAHRWTGSAFVATTIPLAGPTFPLSGGTSWTGFGEGLWGHVMSTKLAGAMAPNGAVFTAAGWQIGLKGKSVNTEKVAVGTKADSSEAFLLKTYGMPLSVITNPASEPHVLYEVALPAGVPNADISAIGLAQGRVILGTKTGRIFVSDQTV
jgi:hypothetical protein